MGSVSEAEFIYNCVRTPVLVMDMEHSEESMFLIVGIYLGDAYLNDFFLHFWMLAFYTLML